MTFKNTLNCEEKYITMILVSFSRSQLILTTVKI